MQLRDTARAVDGCELTVTRFSAHGETAWATVVVADAMGVRQDFYAPFARFLAAHGVHVLTFDYRGMGWSRPGRLAGLDATVSDWAAKDLEAMLGEARRAAPGLPLAFAGHSLGGQILGLAPSNAHVRAVVNVATGSGYWRHNDRMRPHLRIFWYVLVPLLTPLFGYFPGKRLKVIGDLPGGVVRQWRRWCMDPGYALVEGESARAAFDRVRAPILSWSFTDDNMIVEPAVDALNACYRNADVDKRHVTPADVGLDRIGHFGFFLPASGAALWQPTLAWLRQALATSPQAVRDPMLAREGPPG